MYRIDTPFLDYNNNEPRLCSHITDDVHGINEVIWFSTPERYGKYFCPEVADAFVVMLLLPAVQSKQDIFVDAPMSERLYYHISTSVLAVFKMMFGSKEDREIKIICQGLAHHDFQGSEVGCSCSLGVDSLSAIFGGLNESCPPDYRITMLANYNIGAYSDVFDKAHESYMKELVNVREFAEEIKLPLLTVESNMGVLFEDSNFNQSVVTRLLCTVLSMQKLFGKYSIASCTSYEYFSFDSRIMEHCVQLLAPLLSTESTEIFVADGAKNRAEKIALIADNPLTKKYLNVCWREFLVNKYGDKRLLQSETLNCSRCDKCQRTMMALELLGKLDEYDKLFDLKQWEKEKTRYIQKIILFRKNDAFMDELWQLMRSRNYKIPIISWVYVLIYKFKHLFIRK